MEFQLGPAKEILTATPATLKTLLTGLSDEWIFSNEGDGTWTPFDVVGHLIHADETDWIPRARIILEHGESGVFEPFDRFGMFEKSRGKSLPALLEEFEVVRRNCLLQLDQLELTPETLAKTGYHPDLGVVTLSQLLATWVAHDLGHIAQIVRTMSKQYSEAVGPWRAYLSILGK
jgi:hypothetical protein